jgi:dipeptidyl aminopeptidase/acylaminoacyl peptidase
MGVPIEHRNSATALGAVGIPRIVALLLWAVFALLAPAARGEEERWKLPPPEVTRILEAPPTPQGILDPTRRRVLLIEREGLPPLSDLAAPFVPLAGHRLNPRTMGPHGARRFSGLSLLSIAEGRETRIALPAGSDISVPVFSPDGERIAFTRTDERGVVLWIAETASGRARPLTPPRLHAGLGTPFRWMPDGRRLLLRVVSPDRGPAPERPPVPEGPETQETAGKRATARTFPDLLKDGHDEALFEHYLCADLALLDADSGALADLGPLSRGVIRRFEPSPDGRWVLLQRIQRPYSRAVPCEQFAESIDVLPLGEEGSLGAPLAIARAPLREEIPIQGVEAGPRGFDWIDSEPASLLWIEALDGGDPRRKVPHRDRIRRLAAPFAGGVAAGAALLETVHRCTGIDWLDAPARALVTEYDRDRRWTRTWHLDAAPLLDADRAGAPPPADLPAPRLVFDRSARDRYRAPGTPLRTRNRFGRAVVLVHQGAIYLAGQGASPEGDRPFLDRLDLASGRATRLYRSAPEGPLDTVVDVLAPDASRLLITRERADRPPNFHILTLGPPSAGPRPVGGDASSATAGSFVAAPPRDDAARALTDWKDPAASLRRWPPRLLTYARPDGVTLSARLYAPPEWEPGGPPVPLLVWAYPLEYSDPATAGQVAGSPHDYAPIAGISPLALLGAGYAVLDGAAMPVVGDPETVNDRFVEEISAAARAAIGAAARTGVADPERVAIGGHSYGAFMTANLLAHTDLFRAGVARSGAYNRTLTPFGFQGERRTYWEASETYIRMSPFTFAHRIDEPILLVHGRLDQNTGTFPIQSERLFHAIQGNGGTARLVMLPYENHGYLARESVLATQAETIEWLDRHVKRAPPREGVLR